MARVVAVFMIASLFAPCVHAQDARDGNWWNRQDRVSKLDYTIGLIDGASGLAPFLAGSSVSDNNDAVSVRMQAFTGASDTSAKWLSGVTAGQLADGIDQLYSDASNRLIGASSGAWVVLNKIAGRTNEQVDSMLIAFRQLARQTR